ncbi:MAG: molybdopterin converting factor subunit 1 [Candidatus Latescibacteria bacterium]|nr:molybdopterin converting factor subunit 1 [Candidatus Latescibacterota bacterium]
MTLFVKFFALSRQATGTRYLEIRLPEDATAALLMEILGERFPKLRSLSPTLKLAVNWEYADPETILRDGDEVAVIPPVAGG